ncbi:MAG: hypothetical protein IJ583_02295 [Firmicutes bacterium]|nr:hypothetical protein [Bacillota bacterium]
MKYFKYITAVCLFLFCFTLPVYPQENVYDVYKAGNLTITSCSPSWREEMLEELYEELLMNFHGEEINELSEIIIYPDSPNGVNGYYYEDIKEKNGSYIIGNKARIKLFNGERYDTVKKIAPYLSHEYGHHYTISNIIRHEGKYYTDWIKTEYVSVRGLLKYPVVYGNFIDAAYCWDITEIAASDYVQLLGSPSAKSSMDYADTKDDISKGNYAPYYVHTAFNSYPQINMFIPLAADVEGLYEYMVSISGKEGEFEPLEKKPVLSDVEESVTSDGKKQYHISWTPAKNNDDELEYTLVMYPVDLPTNIMPIRTVSGEEELDATFGTVTEADESGNMKTAYRAYEGNYNIVLYTKDEKGFIFATDAVNHIFTADVPRNDDTKNEEEEDREYNEKAEEYHEDRPLVMPDPKRSFADCFNDFLRIIGKIAIR